MFRQSKVRLQRDGSVTNIRLFPSERPEEIDRSKPLYQDRIESFIDGDVDVASGVVNWAASGMLLILDTADGYFIPIGYRDAGAPTHSEKLGTPSGIAETEQELLYPRLMGYREALEEILLFDTENECWLRPSVYNQQNLYQNVIEQNGYPRELYEKWDGAEKRETAINPVDAEAHTIADDTWTVTHPITNETNSFVGKAILDEETLNLDLLDILFVDLSSYSIDQVSFYDGEEVNGELLDRPVYLFPLDEFVGLFDENSVMATQKFQSGEVVSTDVTRVFDGVPVLRKSHKGVCAWCEQLES